MATTRCNWIDFNDVQGNYRRFSRRADQRVFLC